MKSQIAEKETLSGPKNKTLDAYKDWILAIAKRLTTQKSELKLTETEWIENWKDFWKEKQKR